MHSQRLRFLAADFPRCTAKLLGHWVCRLIKLQRVGTPGVIRTPDPLLRRQVLYPAELRAHGLPNGDWSWFSRQVSSAAPMACLYLNRRLIAPGYFTAILRWRL